MPEWALRHTVISSCDGCHEVILVHYLIFNSTLDSFTFEMCPQKVDQSKATTAISPSSDKHSAFPEQSESDARVIFVIRACMSEQICEPSQFLSQYFSQTVRLANSMCRDTTREARRTRVDDNNVYKHCIHYLFSLVVVRRKIENAISVGRINDGRAAIHYSALRTLHCLEL